MSDTQQLTPADAQALLDGIDATFIQIVHGRYGGGVEVILQRAGDAGPPVRLREPAGADRLSVVLSTGTDSAPQANGDALVIGYVSLAKTPKAGIDDVTISTEIFDSRDPNEASDSSYFGGGVLLAARPDHLPGGAQAGGLAVVRSAEAASVAERHDKRLQRGWLPRQPRHDPSRALGLSGNGHRRAPAAHVMLPISADLIGRIGLVVAGLSAAAPPLSVRGMTLLVQTASAGAA